MASLAWLWGKRVGPCRTFLSPASLERMRAVVLDSGPARGYCAGHRREFALDCLRLRRHSVVHPKQWHSERSNSFLNGEAPCRSFKDNNPLFVVIPSLAPGTKGLPLTNRYGEKLSPDATFTAN